MTDIDCIKIILSRTFISFIILHRQTRMRVSGLPWRSLQIDPTSIWLYLFDVYICICTHIYDYALRQQTTTHFTFHFQCIEFDLSYWHKLHEWGSICASTYLILHPPIFLTFFFTYSYQFYNNIIYSVINK